MTWILILTTFYVGFNAYTTTQEFHTKEACKAAGESIKGQYSSGVVIAFTCVEKGLKQ